MPDKTVTLKFVSSADAIKDIDQHNEWLNSNTSSREWSQELAQFLKDVETVGIDTCDQIQWSGYTLEELRSMPVKELVSIDGVSLIQAEEMKLKFGN